ncbi:MAG: hypothetical protein D3926_16990, partial [Desulfobacteraceae bacterium]
MKKRRMLSIFLIVVLVPVFSILTPGFRGTGIDGTGKESGLIADAHAGKSRKLRIAWEKSVSPSDQVKLLLTWQGGSKQQHLATVQNNGQYYW